MYKAVFDAVKAAIETKSAIKTVVLGEQFTVGGLPKAIINAEPSPIKPGALDKRFELQINFSVVLVILEYEPKDWFTDIIAVMGDVVDAVLADTTLNGTVRFVHPTAFSPGEIRFRDKLLYGGVVSFAAYKSWVVT
jgi:hypothetical protein